MVTLFKVCREETVITVPAGSCVTIADWDDVGKRSLNKATKQNDGKSMVHASSKGMVLTLEKVNGKPVFISQNAITFIESK
jgi:hypothetical protein